MRRLGVSYENLVDESCISFSLFEDIEKIEKQKNLESAIDEIRDKYGFTSIQKATSLMEGSRCNRTKQTNRRTLRRNGRYL